MASFQSAALIVLAISMAALAHGTDTFTCEERCIQGHFCGIDNTCHELSCQTYYMYGPRSHTGWKYALPSLSCKDIPITEPGVTKIDGFILPASVAYRCKSLTPPPIEMGFTSQCNTFEMPDSNTEFTCFEQKRTANFQPFLDKVEASGLNCTDSEYDETGYPQFTYGFTIAFNTIKYGAGVVFGEMYDGTSEFNETFALDGTMYSFHKEKLRKPTAAPNKEDTAPPTAAPNKDTTAPTSSAFSNKIKNISNIFTLLGAIVIVSLVCEV